jgi:hypothetical protein
LRRLLKTIKFDKVYGYPNESARLWFVSQYFVVVTPLQRVNSQ